MLLKGNPVLVVGDLHFSAIFTGMHKDYFSECCSALNHISDLVKEHKPSGLVLLGDIIGWSETNIKDHEALHLLFKYFKAWNEVCPVFSLVGNHDMKGHPDFLMFHDLGLIKTSTDCNGYIDFQPADSEETVRLHLVDYHDVKRHIDILDGSSNIALCHDAFTIQGITNWFVVPDAYELGTLSNFDGIEGVIAGHVHQPSPDFAETVMPNGKKCWLFYVGCPTRPQRDEYNNVWSMLISYNADGYAEVTPETWELLDSKEAFYAQEVLVNADSAEEVKRKEALGAVIDDLLKYHIGVGDPVEQINKIPNASEGAKKVAVQYLQRAMNQGA